MLTASFADGRPLGVARLLHRGMKGSGGRVLNVSRPCGGWPVCAIAVGAMASARAVSAAGHKGARRSFLRTVNSVIITGGSPDLPGVRKQPSPKLAVLRRVCGGYFALPRRNGRCDPQDTQLKSFTRKAICVFTAWPICCGV